MEFTDEDLKQLKEHMEECRQDGLQNNLDNKTIGNLIARLEAAEALLDFGCTCESAEDTDYAEEKRLYEVWRKAAGK